MRVQGLSENEVKVTIINSSCDHQDNGKNNLKNDQWYKCERKLIFLGNDMLMIKSSKMIDSSSWMTTNNLRNMWIIALNS